MDGGHWQDANVLKRSTTTTTQMSKLKGHLSTTTCGEKKVQLSQDMI
jgi:hypothetical protein